MAEVEYHQGGHDLRQLSPRAFMNRLRRHRKAHDKHIKFLAAISGAKLKG